MAIRVTCAACKRNWQAPEKLAGKQLKCPGCTALMTVPAAAGPPPLAPPEPPPTAVPPPFATPIAREALPVARPVPSVPAVPSSTAQALLMQTSAPHAAMAPTSPLVQVGAEDDQVSRYRRKNAARRSVPVWTYFAACGVLLAGLLGYAWHRYGQVQAVAAAADARELAPRPRKPPAARQASAPITIDPTAIQAFWSQGLPQEEPTKPADGAKLQDIYQYLEHGIVLIETFDEQGMKQGIGSGFIIDRSGLLATNYHVVQHATRAEAVFHHGLRFEIEGYAGLSPPEDLAILKLASMPSSAVVLDLSYDREPVKLAEVVAIGHPENHQFAPFSGRVSRVVRTSELPEDSQQFLGYNANQLDHTWIEHRTGIAPGNSGGPLIDEHGNVLGINTWVNRTLGVGYALHVRHLRRLRYSLLPAVEPLIAYRIDASEGRSNSRQMELSVKRLDELYAACQAFAWQPSSRREYHQLQRFAELLTYALLAEDLAEPHDPNRALYALLADRADELIGELIEHNWAGDRQRSAVNRFAEQGVKTPQSGTFLFGTILRQVAGEGQQGIFLTLDGTATEIFVPLEDARPCTPGTRCLILGISHSAFSYGDNPLEHKQAYVVLSRAIIMH